MLDDVAAIVPTCPNSSDDDTLSVGRPPRGSLRRVLALGSVLLLIACGDTHESPGGDQDGGAEGDAAPESCSTPGATETVACGNCGTTERVCTDGAWVSDGCTDEGECAAGTMRDTSCGSCGTQAERCNASCGWERVGECTDQGECVPGQSLTTGEGCAGDERQELTCSDACSFETTSACALEPCDMSGAMESLPCGMCGTQVRTCSEAGHWSYGECSGEGVCVPGATDDVACGMCGTQSRTCDESCGWVEVGLCTGEGVCTPGERTRTDSGCPAGETRLVECDATCALSVELEPCEAPAVDVMILLDHTGSIGARLSSSQDLFVENLIRPLLALENAAVGIAYFADFPVESYGRPTDRPFTGGIEPTTDAAAVEAQMAATTGAMGFDLAESMVEALSVLAGGSVPASADPLTCSAGRVAGGCWRGAPPRVVIVYTDAPSHNGPDPNSALLYAPYAGIVPLPAEWPAVASRMASEGIELIVLADPSASVAGPTLTRQAAEMLDDLGQPAGNVISATEAELVGACGSAFARVREVGGY